jgi:hypothetical protein
MSDNIIKLVPLHELPKESPLVIKCAADIKPEKNVCLVPKADMPG